MHSTTPALVCILIAAAVWAVREDMLTHRIPNRLTGALLCTGLALQFAANGWQGLASAVLGVLVGLAALLPFHLMRAMGAGDVKLLAAFGSLLGPSWTFAAAVYTLIAGAALALGYVAVGMVRAAAEPAGIPWILRVHTARERVQQLRRDRFPYALAISVGVMGTILQRGDLQVLLSYLEGSGR